MAGRVLGFWGEGNMDSWVEAGLLGRWRSRGTLGLGKMPCKGGRAGWQSWGLGAGGWCWGYRGDRAERQACEGGRYGLLNLASPTLCHLPTPTPNPPERRDSNVQAMLAKKDIGDEGIGILGRITPSLVPGGAANMRRRRQARQAAVAAAMDGDDDDLMGGGGTDGEGGRGGLARSLSIMSRTSQGQGGGGRTARSGARSARGPRSGRDVAMEAEVLRHVAATEAAVEVKRAQLEADWRAGRADGVSAAVVAREVEEAKRAAAIEFAVHVFVPHKLAAMALNMRAPPAVEKDKEGAKEAGEAGIGGAGRGKGGGVVSIIP